MCIRDRCCNLCLGHGCAGAHDAASDFKCNAQLFPHIEVGKVSAQEMALQQGNLFQLLLQKAQTLLPVGQADIQVVDAGAVLLEKITDGDVYKRQPYAFGRRWSSSCAPGISADRTVGGFGEGRSVEERGPDL